MAGVFTIGCSLPPMLPGSAVYMDEQGRLTCNPFDCGKTIHRVGYCVGAGKILIETSMIEPITLSPSETLWLSAMSDDDMLSCLACILLEAGKGLNSAFGALRLLRPSLSDLSLNNMLSSLGNAVVRISMKRERRNANPNDTNDIRVGRYYP